ncbi:uncharacterized protein B0H18DRAFT_78647 [Fomitopsis serialis]|uniref:uncharacterized protein n=1 Tax=Fomitopsis serialis TaxID=139415 RepID=UPI0020078468|nr:uncharacterized protein B0H18DRAFT_78647 [Neoantrodia serialis]KAH9915987.1 hypothetical protein B0H18DRAFT_78647 [Neoantrodia serialis]
MQRALTTCQGHRWRLAKNGRAGREGGCSQQGQQTRTTGRRRTRRRRPQRRSRACPMRMSAVKTTPMRACASDTSPPAQTHQVCASRLNEPQHAARGPASKSRLLVDGIYHAQTHSGTARASSLHTDTACPRPNSANRTAMNVCQARCHLHRPRSLVCSGTWAPTCFRSPAHPPTHPLGHLPAHATTCQPTRP